MTHFKFDVSQKPFAEIRVPTHIAPGELEVFFSELKSFLAEEIPYVAKVCFPSELPKLSAFMRRDVIREVLGIMGAADQWCRGTVLVVKGAPTRLALQSIFWATRPRHPWLITASEAEAGVFLDQQANRTCIVNAVA